MGVFRTFRTVLGGGDEIFMVLPNYLSPPVPTLSFFVLDHPSSLLGNLNRLVLQTAHPAPLQRFRIFPILEEQGFQRSWVRIPPARVSVFLEYSFAMKRLQRDGVVAGFPKERGNCY